MAILFTAPRAAEPLSQPWGLTISLLKASAARLGSAVARSPDRFRGQAHEALRAPGGQKAGQLGRGSPLTQHPAFSISSYTVSTQSFKTQIQHDIFSFLKLFRGSPFSLGSSPNSLASCAGSCIDWSWSVTRRCSMHKPSSLSSKLLHMLFPRPGIPFLHFPTLPTAPFFTRMSPTSVLVWK